MGTSQFGGVRVWKINRFVISQLFRVRLCQVSWDHFATISRLFCHHFATTSQTTSWPFHDHLATSSWSFCVWRWTLMRINPSWVHDEEFALLGSVSKSCSLGVVYRYDPAGLNWKLRPAVPFVRLFISRPFCVRLCVRSHAIISRPF